MPKIILRLDEQVAQKARMAAARKGTTLSGLVNEMLTEKMEEEDCYQAAMRRFLDGRTYNLRRPDASPPKRAELYDRKVLL
jgi:hypothetical protein